MPSKTDRILSYLPGTFQTIARQSVLRAFVDAFGAELLKAENSLAEVMQSHWVDHADKGTVAIDDLACLAALFGLAPRADESAEEFRDHLKRYVRTSIEGTVTVEGILRVTAENLGLHISDSLDAWWAREEDDLTTKETRSDDAFQAIFKVKSAASYGSPKRPAKLSGKIDRNRGVDLVDFPMLCLKIDEDSPVLIDLTKKAIDPARVMPEEIRDAIEEKLKGVASIEGGSITLISRIFGPSGRLELQDGKGDASELIFGLAPRAYWGSKQMPAMVTGKVDLSRGIDLGDDRYLSLVINGKKVEPIDCAGKEGGQRSIDEICSAVNHGIGSIFEAKVAFSSGQFITLISPAIGVESEIILDIPSLGGDAAPALLGINSRTFQGALESKARIVGRDLSKGIDLRALRYLKIAVDGGEPNMVDLWSISKGRQSVQPEELARVINRALKRRIAKVENNRLILESATYGQSSRLILEPLEDVRQRRFVTRAAIIDEAALPIFGFVARETEGVEATNALLVGKADLSRGVDLKGASRLCLSIDDSPKMEIDCKGKRPQATQIQEIVEAINRQTKNALKIKAASHDETHLILSSPTCGPSSKIVLESGDQADVREALFGSVEEVTNGKDAQSAKIMGHRDISGMVDLKLRSIIRLSVDGGRPFDIDVAGASPRQTFADEIVSAINRALGGILASQTEDGRLLITSPTLGKDSRLSLLPLRYLEVIEYPAQTNVVNYRCNGWSAFNDGVADVFCEVIIKTPQGAVNPGIWNRTLGWQLRLLTILRPGESARIWREPEQGLRAEVISPKGKSRRVDEREIFSSPSCLPANVPFQEEYSKERVLTVPKGRSEWLYLDSLCMRYNRGRFNETCFATLPGVDRTIFNLSRFATIPSEHLFSWEEIPGKDAGRLIEYLTQNYGIGWATIAKIEKIDEGKTIKVYTGKNTILLKINNKNTKVNLEIDDGRTDKYVAKMENHKLNIYLWKDEDPVLPITKLASSGRQHGPVELTFRWPVHRPGSFVVNLPADLPARFGGRLGEMRLGQGEREGPEAYLGSVTEPEDDPSYLGNHINAASSLVTAQAVPRVPLGWEAKMLPFRKPAFLTLGRIDSTARLYLKEKGQKGFIAITARQPGLWGNEISVSARQAGPAMYDISIIYQGDRFECARKIVLGGDDGRMMQPCRKGPQKPSGKTAPDEGMPALIKELLKPATTGVLQAKAAGIQAEVSRDRT